MAKLKDINPQRVLDTARTATSILWDGSAVWARLCGHLVDVEDDLARLGAASQVPPPELPPFRWSRRPKDLYRLGAGTDVSWRRSVSVSPIAKSPILTRRRSQPVWRPSTAECVTCSTPTGASTPAEPRNRNDRISRTLRARPAELDSCVACGLCLPHCPTYRVTGADTHSPRGRIALMRVVDEGIAPLSDEIVESFDSCIQCRACETACPGDVPFGHLLEATKEFVEMTQRRAPWWLKLGLRGLAHPRLLRLGSSGLAVAQRLRDRPVASLGYPAASTDPPPGVASIGRRSVAFYGVCDGRLAT